MVALFQSESDAPSCPGCGKQLDLHSERNLKMFVCLTQGCRYYYLADLIESAERILRENSVRTDLREPLPAPYETPRKLFQFLRSWLPV